MKRHPNFKDLTGQIFERLTVIKFACIKSKRTYWLCKCSCDGKEKLIDSHNLCRGLTRSCGCLQLEKATRHGMTDTKFWRSWKGMLDRYNTNRPEVFRNYRGRGISIYLPWFVFENYKNDLYESYLKHVEEFGERDTTLDRFPNNDGNYEPTNIRWATILEQNRNKQNSSKTDNIEQHNYWKGRLLGFIRDCMRLDIDSKLFVERIGITFPEFKIYFSAKFTEGMAWDNHGSGKGKWNIGHVLPCNQFDLAKIEDRQRCFYYTNLEPQWWEDNIKRTTKEN
jgi:hypothetical protein